MLALQCVKSVPAWLFLRALGDRFPSLATGRWALLRLRDVAPPRLPGPRWVRVRTHLSGICGSDLASITAAGTPFFSPLTSFPFTFGHEAVGTIVEVGPDVRSVSLGDRVVVEPVLHCVVRGISPLCSACQRGATGNCTQVAKGDLAPGVQTGYCQDTGGGWSDSWVAHEVQLHRVPDTVTDEVAVLSEPLACALHGVLRGFEGWTDPKPQVLVLGCGTMGLLTIASLKILNISCTIVALAKHPHQQELARLLGADGVVPANRAQAEALCRLTGATRHQPEIGPPTVLGGFDLVFDCVGSPRSLDEALRYTRARGRTLLVGMPGFARNVDWTTIWYKELQIMGTYTYGMETFQGERLSTFTLALQALNARAEDLKRLITGTYPLARYKEALRSALATGPSRSVKTLFDPRLNG